LTLNTGHITYNDITYNRFYSKMTLLVTIDKKYTWNVTFINVISKVIKRKVLIHYDNTYNDFIYNDNI
jgi:hypothetical protein